MLVLDCLCHCQNNSTVLCEFHVNWVWTLVHLPTSQEPYPRLMLSAIMLVFTAYNIGLLFFVVVCTFMSLDLKQGWFYILHFLHPSHARQIISAPKWDCLFEVMWTSALLVLYLLFDSFSFLWHILCEIRYWSFKSMCLSLALSFHVTCHFLWHLLFGL